jgi:hypothetical protein
MARNTRVEEILKGSKSQDRFKNLRKRGRDMEIKKSVKESSKRARVHAVKQKVFFYFFFLLNFLIDLPLIYFS